jgi:hypothetical protein
MRLPAGCASADALALEWEDGGTIHVTPRGAARRANTLRLRIPSAAPGEELYLSTATAGAGRYRALASLGRAEEIEVRGTGGWRASRTSSAGMPVYRISPAGSVIAHSGSGEASADASDTAAVELGNVVSDQAAGPAQVVLYSTSSGYSVGTLTLVEEGSVAINTFTADPATIDDITQPASVLLSWDVDNATTVLLSGVGIVGSSVTNLQVYVEQTTTFVLTALDASLASVSSDSVTVTVSPSLSSRMVPAGTILLWQGATTTIPTGWALCDGTNGAPDLRDRFVMGAGGSASPGTSANADTHTHTIAPPAQGFQTSYDGAHTHGMPGDWYHRSLSSGSHTGIDTDGTFSTSTQTQSAGGHQHQVSVSFATFVSGTNVGDVRPPWYALAYIMKLSTSSST